MQTKEIEKSKLHILIEIIEYVPNSMVSESIIRKTTGNISVLAIDTGEALAEKISPFDTFIQIIEGTAEVVLNNQPNRARNNHSRTCLESCKSKQSVQNDFYINQKQV
ncbi:cupin domain-containing protein [Sunxiuqinia indica]|uniref:hypothetical protein n=1 Tax=Sunxiuqinia indica TaxID=2692584 RepID=UPI0019158D8D|nr:hypothetical protein [Sunxiuqinia indica]